MTLGPSDDAAGELTDNAKLTATATVAIEVPTTSTTMTADEGVPRAEEHVDADGSIATRTGDRGEPTPQGPQAPQASQAPAKASDGVTDDEEVAMSVAVNYCEAVGYLEQIERDQYRLARENERLVRANEDLAQRIAQTEQGKRP